MHTVTLDEVMPAMDKEIVLASSCSAKTHKAKYLSFNPAQLRYRVKFHDGHIQTSNSYSDPLIAIEKYNSYHA